MIDIEALARRSRDARERIGSIVRHTPLEASALLSRDRGAPVLLKLEQLQYTGSFKLRGASAKLTAEDASSRARGVVTASTGNHGLAVTFASKATQAAPPLVFVPSTADSGKVERLRAMGASVEVAGPSCVDAETRAREVAAASGRTYVSPYNDLEVMAGQGTVGLEIAEAVDARVALDVYIAVGGGGLIAGVAAAIKATHPHARVIGCLPANSAGMLASVKAGAIVEAPESPTLSDATAGGLEPGAVTFPICRALVDDWLTVTEDEIKSGWARLYATDRWIVEGAAAVAVAGLLARPKDPNRTSIIVLCGRNVSPAQLQTLLS